jgi:DNA-binding response OmpR family regulator
MARILVVDDDLSVADAISRTLTRRGHETIVVHNGRDAINAARNQAPELVVLDIVMPGMDGVEVCKRLRADPDTLHLPIIFLTARIMIEDKIKGFEAGADDYLTKPFAIQELELRVRALLRRSEMIVQRSELAAAKALSEEPDSSQPEQDMLAVGELRLNRRTFEVSIGEHTVTLTPVEFDLLSHLMAYPGEIFSSERLLHEVWGYPEGTGDPALVRMHIRNLRAKIEPEDSEEPTYIRTVIRRGYTVRAD